MNRLEAMREAYTFDVWSRPDVDDGWVCVSASFGDEQFYWASCLEPTPGAFADRQELAIAIRDDGRECVSWYQTRLAALNDAYRRDIWADWDSVRHVRIIAPGSPAEFGWSHSSCPTPGSVSSRDELAAAIRAEIKATETRTAGEGSGVRLSATDITYPLRSHTPAPPLPVRPVDDEFPPDGALAYREYFEGLGARYDVPTSERLRFHGRSRCDPEPLTYAGLQAILDNLEAESIPFMGNHRLPPPTREEWTAEVVAAMGKQNPYPWAPLEARRHVDMALDWLDTTLAGIIGAANGWETSGDRREQ